MKKYIRNPRKKEMTNADSELQDEGRDEEKEVQLQQEEDGSSEKTGEGD